MYFFVFSQVRRGMDCSTPVLVSFLLSVKMGETHIKNAKVRNVNVTVSPIRDTNVIGRQVIRVARLVIVTVRDLKSNWSLLTCHESWSDTVTKSWELLFPEIDQLTGFKSFDTWRISSLRCNWMQWWTYCSDNILSTNTKLRTTFCLYVHTVTYLMVKINH